MPSSCLDENRVPGVARGSWRIGRDRGGQARELSIAIVFLRILYPVTEYLSAPILHTSHAPLQPTL